MKFAAGITFYHPTTENINRISTYAENFDIVFIYDNSSENISYIDEIRLYKNIIYFYNQRNDGLPVAFNKILIECYNENIDFLCTLDQDSNLLANDIEEMKNAIEKNNSENIAIYAINPVDYGEKTFTNVSNKMVEVDWAICSGSFLNLKIIKKLNIWYDENYFIDRFDADFCKQITLKNKKIILFNDIQMEHSCGDINHKHSVLRNYYIFRNRYYYNSKYFNEFNSKIRTLLQDFKQIFYILYTKDNKNENIQALRVAREDFKTKRFGKISKDSFKKIGDL